MKANLLSLFRVYQLASQSQSLQSEKVTLPSVSSFKAFMGLKTSGLASGKKISWNKISLPAESWKMSVMSLPSPTLDAGRGRRAGFLEPEHMSASSQLQLIILTFICSRLVSKRPNVKPDIALWIRETVKPVSGPGSTEPGIPL